MTKIPSPPSALVQRVARLNPGIPKRSGKCSCVCQSSNSERREYDMSHHIASAAFPRSDICVSAIGSRAGTCFTLLHRSLLQELPETVQSRFFTFIHDPAEVRALN